MITKRLSLYTASEEEFLVKACDLLGIEYTSASVTEGISHTDYTITGTIKQLELLTALMAYNYTTNIIGG